jgi:SET domain-containing protein
MKKLLPPTKVYIAKSEIFGAGRGVFAKNKIRKDEIIERCPVIEIPEHDAVRINDSMLVTYMYFFVKNKTRQFITLGFGSIYNHSYEPNATYKPRLRENIIDFIAIKDIPKDEEITVNYSKGNPQNKNPLWFEVISSV